MKISIIGTVGVPANYGGFETLVEQLIRHKSPEMDYDVYCSAKSYPQKQESFQGATLKYIPLHANGKESVPYDIISLIKAAKNSDVILILGVSGCCFLPIFRLFSKKKLIVNIDGLEHKRDKWRNWAKKFLKFSEKQAVKYCDAIVTDNKGITDYVREEYDKDSTLIAYGGDHAISTPNEAFAKEVLKSYGLSAGSYALGVCRIVPENNVEMILDAFSTAKKEIAFVGNWDSSDYSKYVADKYSASPYIKIIPAVYDLDTLNVLRSNCSVYIHGHSAGGTNPSLVEAMFFEKPILAFDCIYNRETTDNKALYFTDSFHLSELLKSSFEMDMCGKRMREIAIQRYTWDIITKQYENLFNGF